MFHWMDWLSSETVFWVWKVDYSQTKYFYENKVKPLFVLVSVFGLLSLWLFENKAENSIKLYLKLKAIPNMIFSKFVSWILYTFCSGQYFATISEHLTQNTLDTLSFANKKFHALEFFR